MHKLIILGNGFDIAHGLKTTYSDYLIDLMDKSVNLELFAGKSTSIRQKGAEIYSPNEASSKKYYSIPTKKGDHPYLGVSINMGHREFHLRSPSSLLFKELLKQHLITKTWASFEELYGKLLYQHQNNSDKVKILNNELEVFKSGLQDYLTLSVENQLKSIWEDDLSIIMKTGFRPHQKFETLSVVSFNYTSNLIKHYLQEIKKDTQNFREGQSFIPVHGLLNSEKTPIIFGFGNENSPEYQELENVGNNELLKNFKTFQYLTSRKYRELLGRLNSSGRGIYVQVIGHSLGLTDKTLLRTIFQHENVKNIELVYHEKTDNYYNLLYNAARVFDSNEMMRERVVPLEETRSIQKS